MSSASNEKAEESPRLAHARKRLALAATWGRRIGIAFAVIGIGMQIGAGIAALRTLNWLSNSKETTGIVLELERRNSGRGRSTRAEHIQFTTEDGTSVEFTSSVSTSSPYQPGSKVPVRYDPSNPSDAAVDTIVRMWFVPGLIGMMGLVFTLLGGGMWLQRGKR